MFDTGDNVYVDVVLPLAIPKTYTYRVPDEMKDRLVIGQRAVVQFGKRKVYASLILKIHHDAPELYKAKPVVDLLDDSPIVLEKQLDLWRWLSTYYMCTMGEVMSAALPAGFKLASETKVILNPGFGHDFSDLDNDEYLIAEALLIRKELTIDEIQSILDKLTVYPVIQSLLAHEVCYIKEELKEGYKPKLQAFVALEDAYKGGEKVKAAFELVKRAPKQEELLLAYLHLAKQNPIIPKKNLLDHVKADANIFRQLEDKGILKTVQKEVSRLKPSHENLLVNFELSPAQLEAKSAIQEAFDSQQVCLLHGVTGSGKTEIYIKLIEAQITTGRQVLYMLPEIALTAQIIMRLRKVFGKRIVVYHSKFSNNERVEMWNKVLAGEIDIVLGARSSLFMPFKDLGLVIVDEEHDHSYKQFDPAPRYNGRDAAVYLAHLHDAKVLLGTATPSIESYYNAKGGKYALVTLKERFGGIQLPEIQLVDVKEAARKKQMRSLFTQTLLDALEQVMKDGEQAILFQNRRGYAPYLLCATCQWIPKCKNCDVSLTYHKFYNELRCHYCGFKEKELTHCLACGSTNLQVQGFGTEKIEDELKLLLPDARLNRMDLDTVRSKHGHEKIIGQFESGNIDVLIGTQMVTKGLDFDNVSLVGILSADQILGYPDFRAAERGYQLMAQVSGRSGRKKKRGKVLIQTGNIKHPVVGYVLEDAYEAFYEMEIGQRQKLHYPPFFRLVQLTIKHRQADKADLAAQTLAVLLRKTLFQRVLGPALPVISRIRNYYLRDVLVKINRERDSLSMAKQYIQEAIDNMTTQDRFKSVRVVVDVDPF